MSWWRRLLVIVAIGFLSACAPEPPLEEVEPLRGWNGEVVEDELTVSPEALAAVSAEETATMPPTSSSEIPKPPKTTSTTTTTTAIDIDHEQALLDSYALASQAGANGESILPWVSESCRASLGLAGDIDPLNSYLLETFQLDAEHEVDRTIVRGDSAVVIVVRESTGLTKVPSDWTFEDSTWKAGSCDQPSDARNFTAGQPNTSEGLDARLGQLERLRAVGDLPQYPWLSQRCRAAAVDRFEQGSVFPELISGLTDYWSFANAQVFEFGSGTAKTSAVDPTNADDEGRWVYENGDWHYDNCKRPGGPRLYLNGQAEPAKIDELHATFIDQSGEVTGLTEVFWQLTGTEFESLYAIDNPTTEEDANKVLESNVLPALLDTGYVYLGKVDNEYTFALRSDPCGAATTWVQWADKGIALELHYDDC